MKIIDVPQDAAEINALLDQARCDDLVLRAADGTQFLLAEDFEDEVRRTRNNEQLMALLDERRREPATIPLEAIERELGLQSSGPGDRCVEQGQNQKLMALLEQRRKEPGAIPWDQAKRELGLK